MSLDPIAFTADLIRCPSITPFEGGALDLLQRTLEGLGLSLIHILTLPTIYSV